MSSDTNTAPKDWRVAKRYAQRWHMEHVIAESDRQLEEMTAANARLHQEYELLRPYWHDGVTKEQAIAKYYEANPPEAAGASSE